MAIILFQEYTNSCLSNMMFVVSSNCSASEQVVMVSSQTVIMLPVSTTDYCEVTALVRSDCGDSSEATISELLDSHCVHQKKTQFNNN